jgi:hypothetical protein
MVKGKLVQNDKVKGELEFLYKTRLKGKDLISNINIRTSRVDLPALGFVYDDSLPVYIKQGTVDINSKTTLINDVIDSRNKLVLRDQNLVAKNPSQTVAGFAKMSDVCTIINDLDPFEINFQITGTLDQPQFKGFDDALQKILQPYLTKVATQLAQQGIRALTKQSGAQGAETDKQVAAAVNALQGLFSKQ